MYVSTKAVDVWYLFPLEGVCRQLAHSIDKVDAHKELALTRIFGTDAWKQDLYKTSYTPTLFDGMEASTYRSVSKAQIEAYAIERLRSAFSFVSEPMPLLNDNERHLFSLFLLANPATEAATKLIEKGARWVLNKHKQASRRKFVL